MKKWKVVLMFLLVSMVAILTIIRMDGVNQRFTQFENDIITWSERTSGLRFEIEWLQGRLDVLETPKPTLPEATIIFNPDTIMQSVVHIEADAGWQGGGSYVGNGLILTAGHVVDEGWSFTITFEDGTEYISTEFYLEETADVGFIFIGDCNSPVLTFDDDGYSRGDTSFVYGNPFGWDYSFSVTKGIISSVNRDCDGFFGKKIMLQVDAASWPGNSGGPVTDEEGEIIGILVGGIWGSDNLSLCIPGKICKQSMRIYLEILKLEEME